jgi:hypothetical protein
MEIRLRRRIQGNDRSPFRAVAGAGKAFEVLWGHPDRAAFQAKGRISLVAAVALFRYFPSTSLAMVASCMLDVPS